MSNFKYSSQEPSSTYVMQERAGKENPAKLYENDHMITASMGGTLTEQANPAEFRTLLDVGCGTGSWLIEVAQTYPSISQLVGIDINESLIAYAQEQARAQQVARRIQFSRIDALGVLNFPPNSFDLINQRMGATFLRTWEWPHVLNEFQRLARPGGVVRIVEPDTVESNSPTLNYFSDLLTQALHQSGHFFTLEKDNVVTGVQRVMQQFSIQDIQTRSATIRYASGTPGNQSYYESMQYAFQTFQHFFRKWLKPVEDFETLRKQAEHEMQQPDFVTTWKLTTIWGRIKK